MEFRRHADKLMIGKVDKKKVWGRDGRMRIERVEDPSIAFALPPDEDKPRWVVSMKDSAKRPFRFVVKIKSAEEEETGETFVVQAFLRNPLELHVRDQGARESGWLRVFGPAELGPAHDEGQRVWVFLVLGIPPAALEVAKWPLISQILHGAERRSTILARHQVDHQ